MVQESYNEKNICVGSFIHHDYVCFDRSSRNG